MAFLSFDHMPHQAPVTPRRVTRAPTPLLAPHLFRAFRWLIAIVVLALIERRTEIAFGSPLLGIMAAGLAFLIGVALASAARER